MLNNLTLKADKPGRARGGRSGSPQQPAIHRPTISADLAGSHYAAVVTADHRKNHGLYLTPVTVADFIAAQITMTGATIRLLDPAAGAGILLCATVEYLVQRPQPPARIEIVAYEIDAVLADVLRAEMKGLVSWAKERGVTVAVNVVCADFVLEHAAALRSMGGLFPHLQPGNAFDIVVANPPYFKLNKADPRAQAAAAVVHGQPNIYGLFMAVSAALLRDGGELVFITPRSFASGPYFRLFRERFFNCIRPELVHVFNSRREAFGRDAVLQENIILKGTRQDGWPKQGVTGLFTLSSSHGVDDLEQPDRRTVGLSSVLDMRSQEKVLRLPVTDDEDELMRLVDSWPGSLNAYGLKISTGPVVPFRATEFLAKEGTSGTHVPLLWMNHVQAMRVSWPIARRKPEYIISNDASHSLLVPNKNYVLLRRFSAKEEARRLVAGPYLARTQNSALLGLENHLNYIYRPSGNLSDEETLGLAALFSSALLDSYFRISNGNTQVSATELRTMPLPSRETILEIGVLARDLQDQPQALDAMVLRTVSSKKLTSKVSAVG